MSSKIIIQPSAEVLADLLKSDGEGAWLEVRESIVQEFARRHLKALASAEALKPVLDVLVKDAREAVFREVGSLAKQGWQASFVPSPAFAEAFKAFLEQARNQARLAAEGELRDVINTAVSKATQVYFSDINLYSRIDALVESLVERRVNARVELALKALKGA